MDLVGTGNINALIEIFALVKLLMQEIQQTVNNRNLIIIRFIAGSVFT